VLRAGCVPRGIGNDIADDPDSAEGPPIQAVFRALVDDEERTALVCDDVLAALAQGRRCLVLSQWKEHVHRLAQRLGRRHAADRARGWPCQEGPRPTPVRDPGHLA
jgi:hypothetical protein